MGQKLLKKYNPYKLAILCALVTLMPVLNYGLTVPSELMITLVAWLASNVVITTTLLFYSRTARTVRVNA